MRKCVACQYYDRNQSQSDSDGIQRWGQCRRSVPTLSPASVKGYMIEGVWPHVRDDDWCGEWIAAERSEPPVKHAADSLMHGVAPALRAPLMTATPSSRPASPFAAAASGASLSLSPVALAAAGAGSGTTAD
ncbi:MAG TPA: hypothetical protein VGV08_02260 [Casimicrobiaceae bacterium]|nr:hypothetical protein [Casimicrobiaceae bacterium]